MEELSDLNKFSSYIKKKNFNFFFLYNFIFEKILIIELYLKQFFFKFINLKKNCFKYKYFFFNILRYLIILKKKYLYLSNFNILSNILIKKIILSEKFNEKLITLCYLKKKYLFKLKKKIKKKKKKVLIKRKIKKFIRYAFKSIKKTKSINLN